LLTISLAEIEPWNSSLTVGMRTARPSEVRSSQASLACQESAAFGDTYDSLRGAKPSVVVAFDRLPSSACQRSPRTPRTARQSGAKRQAS
jgi:hypothetical protein